MRVAARAVLTMVLAAVVAIPALAQDAKPKKKGAGAEAVAKKGEGMGQNAALTAVFRLPKGVTLTDEQKKQVNALRKENREKLIASQKSVDDLLTADQKKAMEAARAKAKEEMKKPREINQAAETALGLKGEAKTKYDAAVKANKETQQAVRAKVLALLTPEQKAKLPQPGARRNANKAKAPSAS